jgi:hypothetical protein
MTIHRINADHDALAQSIFNHLSSSAGLANSLTQTVLVLSDEQLAAWLNSKPLQEVQDLFAAHGALGEAINAAGEIAAATLAQWGIARPFPQVDVRSVAEKLANQYRAIELTENGWVVIELERPEPEPEEEEEEVEEAEEPSED